MTFDPLRFHGDEEVGDGLVDLAVNVRTGGTPDWLRDIVTSVDLAAYPDQRAALEAVAARHGRAPEEVLLTAGAAEAFTLIARTFTGSRPLMVHPQFTEPEAALVAAGHVVTHHVLAPPFSLDPEAIPADADLVVIGNPTNPTSVLHPREAIRSLVRPGRLVVVDEAFADSVPGEPESLADEPNLTGLVVVRSLTKTWGIAGLRVGYVLAEPDVIDRLRNAQPHWAVSSPALAAAVACSDPKAVALAQDWAEAVARERQHLLGLLAGLPGIDVQPGARASFVLIRAAHTDVRDRLRGCGFAVRRGETFPGLDAHWIRVAVRDRETSERFVEALRDCAR